MNELKKIKLDLLNVENLVPIKCGSLLPLPDYGCVIRIEQKSLLNNFNSTTQYDTPFINRPFGFYTEDDSLISICPIVPNLGISIEDHRSLTLCLTDNRLGAGFSRIDDCAYMPCNSPLFPNGIPVVIDNGDIAPLTAKQIIEVSQPDFQYFDDEIIAHSFTIEQEKYARSIQKSLYDPQQIAFQNVKDNGFSDDSVHNFWEICKETLKNSYTQPVNCLEAWEKTCLPLGNKATHRGNMILRDALIQSAKDTRNILLSSSNETHRALLLD